MPISEWIPDQPRFNGGSVEAINVIARARSYSPIASQAVYSGNALSARCQGAAAFRSTDNAIGHYAGDATKLYRLVNGTTWTDSSGSVYATGADQIWSFAQFGQLCIATNGVNAPQKITLGSGTSFSNLGGSPPVAKYAAIVRDFLFLGNLSTDAQTVHWSAINNAESWTIGTNQSDVQLIPDGGWIQGIVGGEFGLVFSELAVNRFTYVGGDLIFQRDQLTNGIGATIPGSIAGFSDRAFFVHRTGFYMVSGGQSIVPIGAERVNNYFWSTIDQDNIHRVTSCIDPENNVYIISFPNTTSGGTPNQYLIYNYITNKWSYALPGNHEMIYQGLSARQYTLEDLDTPYPSLDGVPFSLDSAYWTGIGRLSTFSFNTSHYGTQASGPNLEATVDTHEFQPIDGRKCFLRSIRSMVQSGSADLLISIGTRNTIDEFIVFGSEASQESTGRIHLRHDARYFRVKLKVVAGASWTHILGVDEIKVTPSGYR